MTGRAAHVIDLTRNLIERWGPRPAGSPESRGCADSLASEAESFADDVRTVDFPVHPGAFLGWVRILVGLYVLSAAGLWFGLYWISALLIAAGIVILVFQFFLYRELLDPFFPRRTGRNVLASLEPDGEMRGELIVSGHHDSARIFNFLIHKPGLYALRVNGGIAALILLGLVSLALAAVRLFHGEVPRAGIPAAVFTALLVLVAQLWWFASGRHTPGAGDNLASSAAAWEFLRLCASNRREGRGFRHLRVTAASWDAEEAGLRGARAWRKESLRSPRSHRVWNLNLECMYDERDYFLLTSDINGSVPLSEDLARRCSVLMKSGSGLDVECRPIAFLTGGSDAGEAARAGAEATTLMGMPWSNSVRAAVYHTPEDVPDAVSPAAVEAALRLAEDLAVQLDGELSAEGRAE